MKKYLSTLFLNSPVIISILISIWYFYSIIFHGGYRSGFYGDEHAILIYFWIFILVIILVIIGIYNLFSKKTSMNFFVFIIALLIPFLNFGFTDYFYKKKEASLAKILDKKYLTTQSLDINEIISDCNTKFKQPEKVLEVKNSNAFNLKLQDGDVSLLNLTTYAPDYKKFEEFAKNNIIGKEVTVKCPNYNDLVTLNGLVGLNLVNIPVIVSFNGMVLNTSPYINFSDNQGISFTKYIQDNYFTIETPTPIYNNNSIDKNISNKSQVPKGTFKNTETGEIFDYVDNSGYLVDCSPNCKTIYFDVDSNENIIQIRKTGENIIIGKINSFTLTLNKYNQEMVNYVVEYKYRDKLNKSTYTTQLCDYFKGGGKQCRVPSIKDTPIIVNLKANNNSVVENIIIFNKILKADLLEIVNVDHI